MKEISRAKGLRYCREYMIDHNAAQAAVRSGFSPRSARQIAHRLMTKDYIKEEIARLEAEQNNRLGLKADDWKTEVKNLAFSDIRQCFDEDDNLLPPAQWPDEIARAVSAIEIFEEYEGQGKERENVGRTIKLKLWDKNKALLMMGQHLRQLGQDDEKDELKDLADRLVRSAERLEAENAKKPKR